MMKTSDFPADDRIEKAMPEGAKMSEIYLLHN